MGKRAKLLDLARRNPAGLRFAELCSLLEGAGFVKRGQRGSHVVYAHPDLKNERPLPVQEGKSEKAKPYQVRQFLTILEKYALRVE